MRNRPLRKPWTHL